MDDAAEDTHADLVRPGPSTEPDAGMGLFTTRRVAKGEAVVEYRGEVLNFEVLPLSSPLVVDATR